MCEQCEGEYDELQCFACGGRFCANCIDAEMDDESQVCERCVSNGVGDGCRVFICASTAGVEGGLATGIVQCLAPAPSSTTGRSVCRFYT